MASSWFVLAGCGDPGSDDGAADDGGSGETTGDTGESDSESSGTDTTDSGTDTDGTDSDGTGGGPPCASEDDCFGDTPHCDLGLGECTGCSTDADCRGEMLCDTDVGICRDCVSDDDCDPDAPLCDEVSGQCTQTCEQDADCDGYDAPHECDTDRGVCVDCIGNGEDCPYCELDTYSCVGCIVDEDCPQNAPFCGPSYECSPACESDDDCGGLFCDLESARCVECAKNAHCPGELCQANYTCG